MDFLHTHTVNYYFPTMKSTWRTGISLVKRYANPRQVTIGQKYDQDAARVLWKMYPAPLFGLKVTMGKMQEHIFLEH